jgi:hypothetical protein
MNLFIEKNGITLTKKTKKNNKFQKHNFLRIIM